MFDPSSCFAIGWFNFDYDGFNSDIDCGPVDDPACGVCCGAELVWVSAFESYTLSCHDALPLTPHEFLDAQTLYATNTCSGAYIPAECTVSFSTDSCSETVCFYFVATDTSGAINDGGGESEPCGILGIEYCVTRELFSADDVAQNVIEGVELDTLSCLSIYEPDSLYEMSLPDCAGEELTWSDVLTPPNPGPGEAFQVVRTYEGMSACQGSWTATQVLEFAPNMDEANITLPESYQGECGEVLEWPEWPTSWEVSYDADTLFNTCDSLAYTRLATATNGCGNTWSAQQVVSLSNDPFAALEELVSDQFLDCGESFPDAPPLTLASAEACNGEVIEILSAGPGVWNADSSLTFRYIAFSLGCGILEERFQTFSVLDSVAPVLTLLEPDTVVVNLSDWEGLTVPEITLSDACDSNPSLAWEVDTLPLFCPFALRQTAVATDLSGNVSEVSQVVIVQDDTAPEIGAFDGLVSLECDVDLDFPENVIVTDLLPYTTSWAASFDTLDCPQAVNVTQTLSAVDQCGNVSQASRLVQVRDSTPPTIWADPQTMPCAVYDGDMLFQTSFSDNCSESVNMTWLDEWAYDAECPQVHRTLTATDECGNTRNLIQILTLSDSLPPSLDGSVMEVMLPCSLRSEPQLSISDNCDLVEITFLSVHDAEQDPNGEFRRYHVSDGCGNAASWVQHVTYIDAVGGTCHPCDTDETCPPVGASACGPNTTWNDAMQLCVPTVLSAACFFDSDQNGEVGTSDLLNLLSAYGQACTP